MRVFNVVYAAVAAFLLSDVTNAMAKAKCEKPTGDYINSCENIRVNELQNATSACTLTADCAPLNRSINPIYNEAFYPQGVIFTGVRNENGTLYHNAKPWSNQEICAQITEKPAPNGADMNVIQQRLAMAGTVVALGLFL